MRASVFGFIKARRKLPIQIEQNAIATHSIQNLKGFPIMAMLISKEQIELVLMKREKTKNQTDTPVETQSVNNSKILGPQLV